MHDGADVGGGHPALDLDHVAHHVVATAYFDDGVGVPWIIQALSLNYMRTQTVRRHRRQGSLDQVTFGIALVHYL